MDYHRGVATAFARWRRARSDPTVLGALPTATGADLAGEPLLVWEGLAGKIRAPRAPPTRLAGAPDTVVTSDFQQPHGFVFWLSGGSQAVPVLDRERIAAADSSPAVER